MKRIEILLISLTVLVIVSQANEMTPDSDIDISDDDKRPPMPPSPKPPQSGKKSALTILILHDRLAILGRNVTSESSADIGNTTRRSTAKSSLQPFWNMLTTTPTADIRNTWS